MSTQGLITIFLSIIGVLIVSWIGLAGLWLQEKFKNQSKININVDKRLIAIEHRTDESLEAHQETLHILQEMRDVG